ncbi:MAG: type II toxin-antitoxin system VapC family toxin [Leptolyngbyaceae cyanobacterium RU_5_1]|nr:type II toxin-antitoxin system VapC family toxin [Leptolyngbyaceae cyanobacterium RU_5_1]
MNSSRYLLDTNAKVALITRIIQIRQHYRVPLPDAIIVSTAVQMNAKLITAD